MTAITSAWVVLFRDLLFHFSWHGTPFYIMRQYQNCEIQCTFPCNWDLKHWGNKDFKSLATVCRGKQWFIHIDDILLFKNDAIEFEKEKPNKIKIHTLNWNNLNYFSTESDEVRLGYYLYDRLHDIQEWKQLDYKVTID